MERDTMHKFTITSSKETGNTMQSCTGAVRYWYRVRSLPKTMLLQEAPCLYGREHFQIRRIESKLSWPSEPPC